MTPTTTFGSKTYGIASGGRGSRVAKFICKAKLQLFQTTFTILVVMGIAQIIDGV